MVTPRQLFLGFSEIGVQGFGGVLPYARRVLVAAGGGFTPCGASVWARCWAMRA
jgi:hypothetical protein